MLKNPPFGSKSFPKNIRSKGEFLKPKLGLPRVLQPRQHLKKGKIYLVRALSGFLGRKVAYLFGLTNGWTKVLSEALSLVHYIRMRRI